MYGEGISLPDFGELCDVSFVLGIVSREEGALQSPEQLTEPRHIEHRPFGKATRSLGWVRWVAKVTAYKLTYCVPCDGLVMGVLAVLHNCERKFAFG